MTRKGFFLAIISVITGFFHRAAFASGGIVKDSRPYLVGERYGCHFAAVHLAAVQAGVMSANEAMRRCSIVLDPDPRRVVS